MGLVEVGQGKQRFREKQGNRGQRPGWQVRGWPEAKWLEARRPLSQEYPVSESFVLRTYIVGRMAVKKLHID